MVNKYNCETCDNRECEYHLKNKDRKAYNPESGLVRRSVVTVHRLTKKIGCTVHSGHDSVSQREISAFKAVICLAYAHSNEIPEDTLRIVDDIYHKTKEKVH